MRTNEAVWLEKYSRWQIKVQREGVRKTFYSSASGRKGKIECEQKADKFLSNGIVTENIRFEKAYNRFLEYTASHTGTGNIKKHTSVGITWLLPELRHKKVSGITTSDWQKCVDKAYKAGRAKKTLINIRASITAFIACCIDTGIEVQPPRKIKIPANAPVTDRRILQPDALRMVMSLTDEDSEYAYAYQFFVVTGLRPGELCGLQTSDIYDEIVHIRRSYNAYGEFTPGKTKAAKREFFLFDLSREILRKQEKLKKKKGVISPFVFPCWRTGQAMRSGMLSEHWRRLRKTLGTECTLYELRHTFVSIGKTEVPVELMKLLVGHTKEMDTYGVYGHTINGEIKQAAELMEKSLQKVLR